MARLVRLLRCGALALTLLMSGKASPQTSPRDLPGRQLRHISIRDGAPPAIRAIVQGADGFIWIAARDGVFRYDGQTFELIPLESATPVQSDTVNYLIASPDGRIWAGHDWGGVSVIQAGRHTPIAHPKLRTILGMLLARDGSIWVVSDGREPAVIRIVAGRAHVVATIPNILAAGPLSDLAFAADGSLLMLFGTRLIALPAGAKQAHVARGGFKFFTRFVRFPGGRVSYFADRRLHSLSTGSTREVAAVRQPLGHLQPDQISSFAVDRRGAVWQVDQAGILGKYDAPADGASQWRQTARAAVGRMDPAFYPPLLVDREDTVWVGSASGLEQYRRVGFSVVAATPMDVATAYNDPALLHDGRGDLWIRRRNEVFKVARDGALVPQPYRIPLASTPCGSPAGGIWIPDARNNLVRVAGPERRSLPLTGIKTFGRQTLDYCFEDGSGRLWVQDESLLKILGKRGSKAVDFGRQTNNGDPVTIAEDLRGGIYVYMARGDVWHLDGRRVVRIWRRDEMPLGFIEVMEPTPSHLFLGGDRGLVRYDGRRFEVLSRDRFPFLSFVSGIVRTETGDTWLQTATGVLRLKSSELDRAFVDPSAPLKPMIMDMADGLPGPAAFRTPTIAADRWGRIYAMTAGGLARYDPSALPVNTLPPPVSITHARSGTKDLGSGVNVTLPLGASRIEISYAGLSFLDPAKIRFRYRLAGVDADWVDAGTQRRAAYTLLSPGTYHFKVIASNNGGVWNATGATMTIVVPARFYQTWWFLALCVVALVATMLLLYRWRVAVLAGRLRQQASERLRERERIARELHDTLLQSVQGLILRFQTVARRLGPDDPSSVQLKQSLQEANNVIAEGRDKVMELRSTGKTADLEAAVRHFLDRQGDVGSIRWSVETAGHARPLDAHVLEELKAITSEALFNAIRHARALHIWVVLAFEPSTLRITVSDDGVGLPEDVRRNGRGSGFGLVGMRERSARIGAELTFAARQSSGTTVRLTVPARLVYG
jgi:signal transduction histidine kinase/ligand-binding sensor domain-containing protein